MTPRTGLYVALAGLVITLFSGLCMAAVILIANGNPDAGAGWIGLVTTGIGVFLVLGATLGHIVIVVGLVMAGVLALKKYAGKPS
jgi:hypothetical protein